MESLARKKMELGRGFAAEEKSLAEVLEGAGAPAVEGAEVGELFAYRAKEKVTLKRGQAALVPILSERVDGGERVVHWRSGSTRPVNALLFKNATPLTLESGPVTFFDGSTCIGEGLLRKVLKKGMKEMISYAVEAGVTVEAKVDHQQDPVTRGTIAHGILTLTHVQNLQTVYAVKSQLARDAVFILDHAKAGGFTLADRKSTRLNSSHIQKSRMPSSA